MRHKSFHSSGYDLEQVAFDITFQCIRVFSSVSMIPTPILMQCYGIDKAPGVPSGLYKIQCCWSIIKS